MQILFKPGRFFILALLTLALPLAAQTQTAAGVEPLAAQPPPITLTQISDQEISTQKMLEQMKTLFTSPVEFEELNDSLPLMQKQVTALQTQTSVLISSGKSSIDQIRASQSQWRFINDQLAKDQQIIRARGSALEAGIAQLTNEEQRWQQIQGLVKTSPGLNYDSISLRKSLENISNARKQLTTPLQEALSLEKDWQELIDTSEEAQLTLKNDESYLRDNLLNNIQSPIWNIRASDFTMPDDTEHYTRTQLKLSTHYLSRYSYSIAFVFFAIFCTAFFLLRLRKINKKLQENQMGLGLNLPLINRPIAAVIGFGASIAFIAFPYPPLLLKNILALLLFIPIVRLGLPRLPVVTHRLAWLVSIFFIVNSVSPFTSTVPAIQQLWILCSAIIGFVSCIHALIRVPASEERNSHLWKLLRAAIWFAVCAALVAIVGSVVGAITLSQFLITGVAYSTYVGLFLVVVDGIFGDLAIAALYMPASESSHLITRNRSLIVRYISKAMAIICTLYWLHFTLSQFALLNGLLDFITAIMNNSLTVGSMSISLGDVLSVGLTIWLSFKISQLLRFILVEDIAPRTKMARGVPEAIATLSQYCIVLAGFMAAISIAGIDLSKISIMVGALGVGIGIGLQDVVNNFTSGLILLFEQKIKVADIIQCSTVNGKVTHIGMRCSIVRTFDGAEVIVPNSQLASAQVINWTHSDQERRINIPVCVAYGTDPQLVIDTLLRVVTEDKDILADPKPSAFFLRFGLNSMEFDLRAWVSNGEFINEINSRICVTIARQFKEAGINIPFPQQDVYVRSWPEAPNSAV